MDLGYILSFILTITGIYLFNYIETAEINNPVWNSVRNIFVYTWVALMLLGILMALSKTTTI